MTTATYLVLLYGDSAIWDAADDALMATIGRQHEEFTAACQEHGHRILDGKELHASSTSITVRRTAGLIGVTDGPFAESTEQLGGYYLVETADRDGLARLLEGLLEEGNSAEVRPVVVSGG